MSLQELFSNAQQLKAFENAARSLGYTNFNKRGSLYCLSDLNVLGQGWIAAKKDVANLVLVDRVAALEEVAPQVAA